MCSIRDFFPVEYRVASKPTKNFILENRKHVKKLSKTVHAAKIQPQRPCCSHMQEFKLKNKINQGNNDKKNSVKSLDLEKIEATIQSIRLAIDQTKKLQNKIGINSNKLSLAFKDQAVQTVFPFSEELVLKDGTVRYPSVNRNSYLKLAKNKLVNTIAIQTEVIENEEILNDAASIKNLITKQQSKVIKSKQEPIQHKCGQENIGLHQIGKIPKYLKQRKALKEKNDREEQKKKDIRHKLGLDDPNCPPGHMLLPKTERLEHLADLQKNYNRLIMELNMLPLSSDSFKIKEKRRRLEQELDKLQLGIKLFSREKLFIKVKTNFL
ncbi:uncharacterized protein LOC126895973 [Daktulosphaira vitifoliae]|uniref:uncharacterized protein LOC126895973 n=1 Tax=Daktulosphaira vitifoliae TaxID=58002 RepID=UPI0021AA8107|nr:uncharacterized protein LOC126895973 [Daktulosphaira vitifoliae]